MSLERKGISYLILLAAWLITAIKISLLGIIKLAVPPIPQLIIIGIILILVLITLLSKEFRKWIFEINLNYLVLIHITRFVGFYFLILYSEGRLPYDFAVKGGWGDIVVATAAFLILIVYLIRKSVSSYAYNIWNIVGLLDILFVVFTASRLALKDPESMSELLILPLSLLPTFLVPLIIYTHLIIGYRLNFRKF